MTAEPAQKTTLGAFDITCVVVGGIIGIGIFFTPGEVAKRVGSPEQVVAAWVIGGVIALLGALVFARLGRLEPGPGGMFEYLFKAFGPLPAFLYGWCNLLVIQSGALAVVGLLMVDNLDKALGLGASTPFDRNLIATGAIVVLTVVNLIGLRAGRGVQNTLTVIKTAAVLGIVVVAVFVEPDPGGVSQAVPDRDPVGFLEAMSLAMLPVLFAYGGWQHGSFVAQVARRPQRDVPIGVFAGVTVVVVAYIMVNVAYLDLLGHSGAAASKTIAVDAMQAALPDADSAWVARMFAALIVASALGVMNTICMAPPYVLHAMAKRGLFFAPVGRLHSRCGTPVLAITTQGGWGLVLLWFAYNLRDQDPLSFLLDGVVFVDWLGYGSCGVALLVLLSRASHLRQELPYAFVAVLFALAAVGVTAGAVVTRFGPSGAGLAVVALGFVAYRLFLTSARTRSRR